MPTQWIEKIADHGESLAPAADAQLWAERRASLRLRDAERGISDLSTALLRPDREGLERGIDACLEIMARVFPATRVVYYRAEDPVTDSPPPSIMAESAPAAEFSEEPETLFCASRLWVDGAGSRAAERDRRTLSLSDFPDHGKALLEGQESRGPRSLVVGSAPGWRLPRSTMFIPCPGEDGLFGLFEVLAAESDQVESPQAIERSAHAARVLGAAFDRARLRDELDRLGQDQKRGKRLETLGRVASSVAHDFNNVLTAILGYADLLEMELAENGTGQSELGEIRQAANRAAGLVDQVLTFGRTRTAGNESIDLAETIECMGGMLKQVLGDDIALQFDWMEKAPRVELDRARLGPVLMNLASNARGALEGKQGAARFSLTTALVKIDEEGHESLTDQPVLGAKAGSYLLLTARDNGCGVDPAIADRIFEPFFTTKDPGAGTGLGLASLSEFVLESNGGLRMESELGQGTAFHLYLPVPAPNAA